MGTAAMDLQQYVGYRLGGGKHGILKWEFGSVEDWQEASAPGKVGQRLVEAWTGKSLSPRRAGLTNTIMHWGFGIQWGAAYGVVAGSIERPPVLLGLPFGAFVWLFGYTVLPLGRFYQPIWEYDAKTLAEDLGTHLVYGTSTGVVFRLLSPR
jgi:hypothetical protein